MSAISYPDRRTRSPDGRYLLEARSPHNGTIRHRDGAAPTDDEFGFRYRQQQRAFRYRLLDAAARPRRVVWERWQEGGEDSPHVLHVSDRGWSVVRTHGGRPEVIAVDRRGRDVARVRVVPPFETAETIETPVPAARAWVARHTHFSIGDHFWSLHAWPYFLHRSGADHFVCRTYWGDRLIIDLRAGRLVPQAAAPAELARTMDGAERRAASKLLADLTARLPAVRKLLLRQQELEDDRDVPNPLRDQVDQVVAAIAIVGAQRVAACLPLLRKWEPVESRAYTMRTHSMAGNWDIDAQFFRPIVQHAIKRLAAVPAAYPVYRFGRDYPRKKKLDVPETVADRRAGLAALRPEMTARGVLTLCGSPDHIHFGSDLVGDTYEWREEWEYDSLESGGWSTLRITWRGHARRRWIEKIEDAGANQVDTETRLVQLPCYYG